MVKTRLNQNHAVQEVVLLQLQSFISAQLILPCQVLCTVSNTPRSGLLNGILATLEVMMTFWKLAVEGKGHPRLSQNNFFIHGNKSFRSTTVKRNTIQIQDVGTRQTTQNFGSWQSILLIPAHSYQGRRAQTNKWSVPIRNGLQQGKTGCGTLDQIQLKHWDEPVQVIMFQWIKGHLVTRPDRNISLNTGCKMYKK